MLQGEAIIDNRRIIFSLVVPITVVTGEGSSGDLATGCAIKLFTLENVAFYVQRAIDNLKIHHNYFKIPPPSPTLIGDRNGRGQIVKNEVATFRGPCRVTRRLMMMKTNRNKHWIRVRKILHEECVHGVDKIKTEEGPDDEVMKNKEKLCTRDDNLQRLNHVGRNEKIKAVHEIDCSFDDNKVSDVEIEESGKRGAVVSKNEEGIKWDEDSDERPQLSGGRFIKTLSGRVALFTLGEEEEEEDHEIIVEDPFHWEENEKESVKASK
nr:acetyl-coenzyme A carboxylase carboxyl transferase subunit alpha, chloroplastic-like [Tanacetum cinerariifolium]